MIRADRSSSAVVDALFEAARSPLPWFPSKRRKLASTREMAGESARSGRLNEDLPHGEWSREARKVSIGDGNPALDAQR